MKSYEINHISTSINGRFLVNKGRGAASFPVLVGFHGYGEDAEVQLERMLDIPGSEKWYCISIQALHSFYIKRGKIGASWLTR